MRSLKLRYCDLSELNQIEFSALSNLEDLDLPGNIVEHLPGLEQHKALKRIVLRSVPFSRDGLYALGKVKNLEQLTISDECSGQSSIT